MEEVRHKYLITKCFENKTLMPKDVHHISESIWKNEEDSTKNKSFYSLVEWNTLASKTYDQNSDDDCRFRDDPFIDKTMRANVKSNIECDDK